MRSASVFFFLTCLLPAPVWAGFLIEGQLNASAISLASQVTQTSAQQFGKFGAYLAPGKDEVFWFGGGVSYLGQSIQDGTTDRFAVAEYVVGMRLSLTKRKWFWLGADISPASQGVYKAGDTESETWKGSSFQGMIHCFYPTSSEFLMGFSITYYSGAFSTPASSSKTAQTITGIFPTLTLGYQW
ncbi:MAG: hypothetical protein K2X47_13020 [Bdellovibrionales bacterium]|nr:hypothetical protein [Bdellovibrionales bacterium]